MNNSNESAEVNDGENQKQRGSKAEVTTLEMKEYDVADAFEHRRRIKLFHKKKEEFKKKMLLGPVLGVSMVASSGQLKFDETIGKFVFMEKVKFDAAKIPKHDKMKK